VTKQPKKYYDVFIDVDSVQCCSTLARQRSPRDAALAAVRRLWYAYVENDEHPPDEYRAEVSLNGENWQYLVRVEPSFSAKMLFDLPPKVEQ
jgi:hypothetical protein